MMHDEFYHIGHTIQFYQENYDYDKYITTPPGLYIIGKGFLHSWEYLFGIKSDKKHFVHLRYLNSAIF